MEFGTNLNIFIIGIGVMFIFIGIVLLFKNINRQYTPGSVSGVIPALIAMITGMGVILMTQVVNIPEIEPMTEVRTKTEIYTEAVNNGYTVYVDGTEVKPDTINVSDYKMTVNDENHNILLSTSDGDSRKHLILLLAVLMPMMLSFSLFKK